MSETGQPAKLNIIERFLIWLSAADSDILVNHCPKWERLKYAAFGASLLVPFLFGMIAASYAVSTLTDNVGIIAGFAVVWGFIIITIDRVLLATYRSFISFSKKMLQFILRITVAVLMGLTVSHPLTLMLFRDAINSEIERERMAEMSRARGATDEQKAEVNARIAKATENLQGLQQRYQEVIGGNFLNAPAAADAQMTPQQANQNAQFDDLDDQIKEFKRERDQVQSDLNRWQKVYDDEISGARTGKPGIGPNARAIERDELVWRRDEVKRLNGTITELTKKRTDLSAKLLAESAAANARIEASRREFEEQKLEMFKQQQGELLAGLKDQIASASDELKRLRTESEQITDNTIERVDSLKDEKRSDLMVQTMVLHHMFEKEGGGFALAVYIVITGLFTLIDTIPLVVKFFAEPGIYDHLQEAKEKRSNEQRTSDEGSFWTLLQKKPTHELKQLSIDEIKAKALEKLLNDDISHEERLKVFQDTLRRLDLVETVHGYLGQDVPTDDLEPKRLPYHPELEKFDKPQEEPKSEKVAEVVEVIKEDKAAKTSVVELPEKKIEPGDAEERPASASNVIPFLDRGGKKSGQEEDPKIPEPRKRPVESEVKADPQIKIQRGDEGAVKIQGTSNLQSKRINGAPKPQVRTAPSADVATSKQPAPVPVKATPVKQQARPKPVEQKPPAREVKQALAIEKRVKQPQPQPQAVAKQAPVQAPPVAKEQKAQVSKQDGNISGSIAMPSKPAAPKTNGGQKAIEGTIFDTGSKKEKAPAVKPANDFVEEPEDNGYVGLGKMMLQQNAANDNVVRKTGSIIGPASRRNISPGGLSFSPLNESNSEEDAS